MSDYSLAVKSVSVVLGHGDASVRALSDVSLSFPSGSITLIMGPSGSGKTTLLSVLGGLLKPQNGSVLLDEQDLTTARDEDLNRIRREKIGFIFQSFRLFDSLTALENVMFAMEISGHYGERVRSKAERHLEELGISGKKNCKPRQLSGGEKQRVAIARALMREPKIVLADEPTASLDSKAGDQVARILSEIAQAQHRTVVLVSHDERLSVFANQIVNLHDGRVAEQVAERVAEPVAE